jgi:hypothetical protein
VALSVHTRNIQHELTNRVEPQAWPTFFRAKLLKQLIYFTRRPPSVAIMLAHPGDEIFDSVRLGNISIRLRCRHNFIVTGSRQFDQP